MFTLTTIFVQQKKARERSVKIWNASHSIGATVIVTTDQGKIVATKTQSDAYILEGHTAVIMLEGFHGCYLLARVRDLLKCMYCGCDDLHACAGGCSWSSKAPPICSKCSHKPSIT